MYVDSQSYSPKEEIIRNAMKFVCSSQLDGDYLEFGVYEGFSFASAFHFAHRQGLEEMKFFAFDSFQG